MPETKEKNTAYQTVLERWSNQPQVVVASPGEWAQAMSQLAEKTGKIHWARNRLVSRKSRRIHDHMNDIRRRIEKMPADVIALIPAALWFIDNFQVIYREIKSLNFSTAGEQPIPILKTGFWNGLPRAYVIAQAMVGHPQGQLHEESILMLTEAYQEKQPLTGVELQILPDMLGLCLLEHILQLAKRVEQVINAKARAQAFVSENLDAAEELPDISALLARNIGEPLRIPFHSHVLYLMKGLALDEHEQRRYIDFHFRDDWQSLGAPDIFKLEGREESMLESAIRVPITSLRSLNEIDEEVFFTALSRVEKILNADPSGVYPGMDAASRADYRGVIGKLAMRTKREETEVASACVGLAETGHAGLLHPHHVGTYLLGEGKRLLTRQMAGKKEPLRLVPRMNYRGISYFTLLFGLALLFEALLFAIALSGGPRAYLPLMLASLPLALGIGVKVANTAFTTIFPARSLPAMEYTEGIPEQARTMVIMPVIMSRAGQGLNYLDRLLKHSLANRQENLYFALLADYADADEAVKPGDLELRDALVKRVRQLNAAHPAQPARFSLFMRERRYNPSEGIFMCWERKRGKLEEFNRLLNGADAAGTSFTELHTSPGLLGTIKYIITLDADSDLLLDNASKLVGIIDHPLNSAVIDPETGKVISGYAIVQPQVVNRIAQAGDSAFSRIYAGKTGISNYTLAISDIYQDLFHQGIFVGKGIYNVRAFHSLLDGAIPENQVLSHDLLESCYARTAFTGSARIIESFPKNYASFIKRQHRWVRGDWQLLPWLFRDGLSLLSKRKILDDLRASILPAAKLTLLFLNLPLYPEKWWLVPAMLALPLALDLLGIIRTILAHWFQRRRHVLLYRKLASELGLLFARFVLELAFLPYEAYSSLDAIIRTLYRLSVSKRRLLLWETAELADRTGAGGYLSYLVRMWPSIPLGLALLALPPFLKVAGAAAATYSALGLSFVLSHLLASRLSLPAAPQRSGKRISHDTLLMDTARRSWRLFRAFSGPDNHYLMPDNYQPGRKAPLATKTSPTNLGLQLLSALTAYDLGFETLVSALDFLERTWNSILALPSWNGHLYNWYDTRTLGLLHPRYVSTVDSGNFIGYLIALRHGLEELADAPLFPGRLLDEMQVLLKRAGGEAGLKAGYASFSGFFEDLGLAAEQLMASPARAGHPDGDDFLRLAGHIRHELDTFDIADMPFDTSLSLSALGKAGHARAGLELARIQGMIAEMDRMIASADFSKLYNSKRKLFSIGFNATDQAYDKSCYDLIASESMLTSLIAIAKGDVPSSHWRALGRPLTIIQGRPAHVSWSGTMFEYLLNHLVVQEFPGTVFDDSSRAAVYQQRRYAKDHNIPWGISESQYHLFDLHHNYQYKAFGVPMLRLQPVYNDMLVVSPYSTLLALEFSPHHARENLRRLKDMGVYGEYGFYEALDFTVPDPGALVPHQVVKSFMAHHQGMGMVAINNYLHHGIMRSRFHRAPIIQAAQGLLEEKHQSLFATPSRRGYTVTFKRQERAAVLRPAARFIRSANLTIPAVNYLSNGQYSVLITADGDGFSRQNDIMLYRWRPDVHANTGFYLYVRDTAKDSFWSATHHPTQARPDRYQAIFHGHMTEFVRQDEDITSTTQVSLLPDANLEIRRLRLKNNALKARTLEVTSYMEVVVDDYRAESSHPAFNKLFLEVAFDRQHNLLLASRRNAGAGHPVGMQALYTEAPLVGDLQYETSRARFIGRNSSLREPQAMRRGARLSSQEEFTGDPIMSLRAAVRLRPGEEVELTFLAGLVKDREEAFLATGAYATSALLDEALARFRRQSLLEFKYVGVSANQQRVYQNIIQQLYYPYRYLRGPAQRIQRNRLGQSGLWKFSISGDNPLILLQVDSASQVSLVKDVLKVYEYLGINGISVDLVIHALGKYGYHSEIGNMLNSLTSQLRIGDSGRERPGIFILHAHELSLEETDLLYTVARVVFTGETGIYFRKQMETR